MDLVKEGFYADNDPTHSIVDPVKMKAYVESSGPVKLEGNQVVAAADAFRTTGSFGAARCVVRHMELEARSRSLTGRMSSRQAYYVQGWVLGAQALAYLKVRNSGVISKEQSAVILPWLREVARQTRGFYEEKEKQDPASQNNHLYWAAVELAAVGIAADNRDDFSWAMRAAREGIAAIGPGWNVAARDEARCAGLALSSLCRSSPCHAGGTGGSERDKSILHREWSTETPCTGFDRWPAQSRAVSETNWPQTGDFNASLC